MQQSSDMAHSSSEWPVLIKADDLSINSSLTAWNRFLDALASFKASCDIGLILKPAEDSRINELRRWIEAPRNGLVSFFNHGAAHKREEFRSEADRSTFAELFRTLAERELRYTGRRLEGFGSPYNSLCAAAIAGYFDANPNGYIYYPDRDPAHIGIPMGRHVTFRYHVSFELKERGNDPSYEYFRRAHRGRIERRRPMVLQVHPGRWSDDGIEEFARILRYLRHLGAHLVTASQFIETCMPSQNATSAETPDVIAKRAGGWFSQRFDDIELSRTSKLVEELLDGFSPSRFVGSSALDLGCGIGDWLYVLRRKAPFESLYGLEPKADVAALAQKILDADAPGKYRIVNHAVGGLFDVVPGAGLTLCNRALTFIDIFDYIDCIEAHSMPSSLHFIGYQSISFYWIGMLAALTHDDLELARRRATVMLRSLRYLAGLDRGRGQEVVLPVGDLIAVLGAHGYVPVRRFPVQRHGSGVVMVEGLVFERGKAPRQGVPTEILSHAVAFGLKGRGTLVKSRAGIDQQIVDRISRVHPKRAGVTPGEDDPISTVVTGLELLFAGRIEDCIKLIKANITLHW